MARVINQTNGAVLGERVDLAITFFKRLRGLIGSKGWKDRDGLWIEPCTGVHGFGLGYDIDVILVDDSLTTLWIGTLRPWRVGRVHLDARAALELPKGMVERTGTTAGDQLVFER